MAIRKSNCLDSEIFCNAKPIAVNRDFKSGRSEFKDSVTWDVDKDGVATESASPTFCANTSNLLDCSIIDWLKISQSSFFRFESEVLKQSGFAMRFAQVLTVCFCSTSGSSLSNLHEDEELPKEDWLGVKGSEFSLTSKI